MRGSNRHYYRRRRRNPGFGGGWKSYLQIGAGGVANYLLARILPENLPFLSSYNTGWGGVALNGLVGVGGALVLPKLGKMIGANERDVSTGAWIGAVVAVGARIFEQTAGSSDASMSGDLGYYMSDAFPYGQPAAGGPLARFPGTPYGPAIAPVTSAAAVRAGAAAATKALAAAPAVAAVPASTGNWRGSGRW